MASVAGDIAGAQAQVLSAAEISLWARVRVAKIEDVEGALWRERSLTRAWCMRRTMFLLPSDELAVFARGTARRPEYLLRWAHGRVNPKRQLDRLLENLAEILTKPQTRNAIASALKSMGYGMGFKAGGGWGDKRAVPWVEVGGTSFSIGFILHIIAAKEVLCSGPNVGNESTYVRADRWVPHWKDKSQEIAEEELLLRYLRAFGPATPADFALWAGLYVHEVKEIWPRVAGKIAEVDVDGWKAGVLQSDLAELEKSRLDEQVVRLLPFFDTYGLGHKSHQSVVDLGNRKKVYRAQGWVSPVLLLDGRAQGVWSHVQRKGELEVRVAPFSKLTAPIVEQLRAEASSLGRFIGCPTTKTVIS